MSIIIDSELCTGCGACVDNCPYGGMDVKNNVACITGECTLCGACVDVCPVEAITIEKEEFKVPKMDLSKYKGVMVIGEHFRNEIQNVVYQLLGKGRSLAAKLGVKVSVVLLGSELDDKLEELGQFGADEVIYVKSPILKDYYSDLYVNTLTEIVQEKKPEIVLIGATPTGRDFAPRLSKRLYAGCTADCTGLDIEEETGNLLQTRPTFGGNIMATIRTPTSRPQMSTVRPGIFDPIEKIDKKPEITIIEKEIDEEDSVTKILKIIDKEKAGINLEEAEIIVSGGRGVGGKENFKIIEELADALGGEVAGSRVTVELEWIDHDRQVGQTGKTVSPKLYIACGISGAIQHLVGMENSDIIVAINKDPNASIFDVAHYGIVDDLHKVVPALTEEIKRRKAGK
ncbi:MAG: 4Fe-4S dicluster domain-containing protein [Candidatus Lokiarchaeota archaeon]|jgi:electron transfer flavoprotein alpha subunit|nr:4Fe-4S dicluster domain-containing protein [Candidatus Lokiarchaeota archaeon]